VPLEWKQFALEYSIGNRMSLVDTVLVASYISKRSVSQCVPAQGTTGSKEWKENCIKKIYSSPTDIINP